MQADKAASGRETWKHLAVTVTNKTWILCPGALVKGKEAFPGPAIFPEGCELVESGDTNGLLLAFQYSPVDPSGCPGLPLF